MQDRRYGVRRAGCTPVKTWMRSLTASSKSSSKGTPKPFKAPALDPVKVHPSGYKVELDNPQVRVIRVRMNPKQKIPLHEHALNRVVVYLKPQKIKVTPDGGAATEISPAENEVRFSTPGRHTEENLGDGPVELLMIELK